MTDSRYEHIWDLPNNLCKVYKASGERDLMIYGPRDRRVRLQHETPFTVTQFGSILARVRTLEEAESLMWDLEG